MKGTGILREKNKRKVLSLVRQLKETTRKDLVNEMNVSKNTISLIVDEFISDGILKEVGIKETGAKGRPKVKIKINKDGYKSIGCIISKSFLEYSVVNYYGHVLEQDIIRLNGQDSKKTKKQLSNLIQYLLKSYNQIIGIGIGVPGIVDSEANIVRRSTHLNWINITFKDVINQFDIPFVIQNSVNMAALGVIGKVKRKAGSSLFYIHVGEGVGGSFIIDHHVMNGASSTAGEIGHISIDPHAERCDCGQKGCLEFLINHHAFRKELSHFGYKEDTSLPSLLNESTTNKVMSTFGSRLGKALVPIIHLMNPNDIFIDSLYNSSDAFSRSCLNYVSNNALEIPFQQTRVTFGQEKSNMSVGAALTPIVNYENALL